MAKPEPKYAMTRLAKGDWLLPDNNGVTLWRICRGQPSEGWELWKWVHRIGENMPAPSPEWADWEFVQGYHETRAEAVRESMRIKD